MAVVNELIWRPAVIEALSCIYLSEFAMGLYVGLGIGLVCLYLLHRRVRLLWGPHR
jgi:hypothetical protein